MNNIVLFQPEIPANTGNIARTCVGTNTRLHLIRPLGFSIDDKHYYLITKFGKKNYCDFDFSNVDDEEIYFIFGRETKGLPKEFREKYSEQALRIPMSENVRSLNLSNTAALVIYEALRQQNFNKLK